ncbi:hypothetical protein JHK85_011042 [Glycine max]|uniref:Uncharacterized protein n=1 Tax=Glycine max TaxID=3847 RepID=A0A0R0KH77_SOYBN|nr:hypothetical protein JHK85_011042 [Glycine max]KAG5067002.1 hypothetical protein JHK86_010733 [Glycine max]KAH1112088.1 hypothetical protein GYH30_010434 [Glycine max]
MNDNHHCVAPSTNAPIIPSHTLMGMCYSLILSLYMHTPKGYLRSVISPISGINRPACGPDPMYLTLGMELLCEWEKASILDPKFLSLLHHIHKVIF